MITAKEAAELSETMTASEHLSYIESEIKAAAKNKSRKIMLRDEPYARWLYSKPTGEAAEVVGTLQKHGYRVQHYYQGHSIAVDMALVISW